MKWRGGRRSSNIEDRRGAGGGLGRSRFPGGLRFPQRLPGRGIRVGKRSGLGGLGLIVVVVLALFFGVDPSVLFQGLPNDQSPQVGAPATRQATSPQEQELADFVSVVLADTEDTWHTLFDEAGRHYREPTLVLFSGAVRSACGYAQSAVGPFYCPADEKVYIDLDFYDDLRSRFRAPGDFAQAYVVAHEVGHHVQTLLGISQEVHAARQGMAAEEANALSVRLELQADCFAGVWGNHADRTRQLLEEGDLEEGLNAASAIGDDRLQRRGQGYVVPESFTHGSSAQRVRWFRQGFKSGDIETCDTFGVERP